MLQKFLWVGSGHVAEHGKGVSCGGKERHYIIHKCPKMMHSVHSCQLNAEVIKKAEETVVVMQENTLKYVEDHIQFLMNVNVGFY